MTVKELITELEKQPPDATVWTQDTESFHREILSVTPHPSLVCIELDEV